MVFQDLLLPKENKPLIQELELDRHVLHDTDPCEFFPQLQTVLSRVADSITSLYVSLDIFDHVDSRNESTTSWKSWFFQTLLPQLSHLQSLRVYSAEPSRIELPRNLSRHLQSLIITRCQIDHIHSIEQHPNLVEIKFLDILIPAAVAPEASIYPTTTTTTLDQVVKVLATIPQLETLDITVATDDDSSSANSILHRRNNNNNKNTNSHNASNTTNDNKSYHTDNHRHNQISPNALRHLFQSCPHLTDMSLWDCGLTEDHLLRVIAPALQHTNTNLEFLSVRRNPDITSHAWCTFYTQCLPTVYGLQALYNDHAELVVCTLQQNPMSIWNNNNHRQVQYSDDRQGSRSVHQHPEEEENSKEQQKEAAAKSMAELYLSLNQLGRGTCYQANDDKSCVLELLQDVSASPTAIFTILTENLPFFLPNDGGVGE